MASLFPPDCKLVNAKGESMSVATALAGKKRVALYFSAHWCPPCRSFTPVLATKYNEIKTVTSEFEVVFISSDRDEASFKEYLNEMPWLAVQFSDKDTVQNTKKLYGVSGIPMLVIVDEDGNKVTQDGRSIFHLAENGQAAWDQIHAAQC